MANTDPNNWFLDGSQIRRDPTFTSENEVTPLIDGSAYMAHLDTRLSLMGQGDYFHMTGWRVTPEQFLQPTLAGPVKFQDQVTALINAGVTVRAMLWYFPGSIAGIAPNHPGENIRFVKGVIDANTAAGALGTAILDERLRRFVFSSHHQKTVILSSDGDDWAYVGGIDICLDRWDTPDHNSPPQRQKEFLAGWHDVHCAVRGAAVAQVWTNFTERWNDRTPPHTFSLAPGGSPPPVITDPAPAGASFGTHHVQVLRTLVCNNAYPFAPGGEQTARLAYERAIERSQHYVYIEEQYFWPCSLVSRLRDAADRGVKIILVLARDYDLPVIAGVHVRMRAEAINEVRRNSPQNVLVYHLEQPNTGQQIYVHSKMMIVDDCFAAIGTANVNKRSHTTDSELHLGIVDADTIPSTMNGVPVTVCRFAKELRLALWREHLGLPSNAAIDDPITGLAAWPNCSSTTRVHHAACHQVAFPTVNQDELRRALLQILQIIKIPILATAIPDPTIFIPDALLAVLIPDPEQIIRDFVMNVETTC